MENTTIKQNKLLIIIYLIITAGVCIWSIYSIYQGALSISDNPIDSNVFEGGSWFGGLFIIGLIISFGTGWDDYKAVDTYADGHKEENATDGCIATLLSNFIIKPAIVTLIIYYALYFLIEIAIFLLPYVAGIVIVGGLFASFRLLLKMANEEKRIPLIITLVCSTALYIGIGYFLSKHVDSVTDPSPEEMIRAESSNKLTPDNLKGTWRLVSEKKEGQSVPLAQCKLIFTETSNGGNAYKLIEVYTSKKNQSNYSLMSNTIIMRLKITGDNIENQYTVVELNNKKMILTFVYFPEETSSGELIFEKE